MKAVRLQAVVFGLVFSIFPGLALHVPPRTYYLYGRFYRITKPVRGGGMVWNFKVQVAPGPNTLRLTVDDAALK